jgi:alginate O-acetyltransferase complex protein AlgJ
MKKFIYTLIIFSLPIFIYFTLNFFLVDKIAYRPYEAISFYQSIPYLGHFYPNSKMDMTSVGDLCHHTKYAVQKKESWETDSLGFRNHEIVEHPDILFIGDSFFAGTGMTQSKTIDNSVKECLGNRISTYNMAPASFSKFDFFFKNGIIKKPKLIVFSNSERYNIERLIKIDFNKDQNQIHNKIKHSLRVVIIDKLKRFYLFRYLMARIMGSSGSGIAGADNSNMYFFKGKNIIEKNMEETIKNAENIISYRDYCDSLGCSFLYVPMPNKESVYFDFVPLDKQPVYLFKLDSILKEANVSTINTLEIYNNYRKSNTDLLYHLDDTHWNSNATELISKEIAKKYRAMIEQ